MTPSVPASDAKLYRQVLDNVDRAIIALDAMGKVRLFNPTAQAYTGISERQAMGQPFGELFAGQQALLDLVFEAEQKGRAISDPENIQLQRPMSSPLPVSVSVCPLLDAAGNQEGVVLLIRDLTRIRELEDAVRRADRLGMLGTLAAGLAHEIKNPLGGIKGAAQLLAQEMGDSESVTEYTQVMIREADRVNQIIEELMDLGNPRPANWGEVDVSRILNDIVLFQKEALRGREIGFRLFLDPSIPPISGDENLLTRLFLNLIKNAGEAVERGGRIEIRSRIGSEMHLTRPGTRPVPFIEVDIIDDGCGIPGEHLEQVFTPFFTSKTTGSGLGLSICQRIVTEHQGFMKISSTPGEGTQVRVALPFIRQRH